MKFTANSARLNKPVRLWDDSFQLGNERRAMTRHCQLSALR
jgi:hypothetical protein